MFGHKYVSVLYLRNCRGVYRYEINVTLITYFIICYYRQLCPVCASLIDTYSEKTTDVSGQENN